MGIWSDGSMGGLEPFVPYTAVVQNIVSHPTAPAFRK